MKLIACMACRNEDWVGGLSLRAALQWNDAVVVLLHECSDGSEELVAEIGCEHPGRVIVTKAGGGWDEMSHRQQMLEVARDYGATHISIVDFDEVLTGDLLATIRGHIEPLHVGAMLQLPGYNLRGGLNSYHVSGIWAQRWFSVAFKDDPRREWSGDRFHQRDPGGPLMWPSRPILQTLGGVMHLWGANERRLVAKHALYKMVETLRWPEKSMAVIDNLYNLAFDPAANKQFDQLWRYADVPGKWWGPYMDLLANVKLDAEPWQEAECHLLYAEHGARRFEGLNLFGVCEPATVSR